MPGCPRGMAQAHGREAGEGDASPSDLWPKELRGKVGNPGQFSSLFLLHLSWGKRGSGLDEPQQKPSCLGLSLASPIVFISPLTSDGKVNPG